MAMLVTMPFMSAVGDAMHCGQRAAALGTDRLREKQMRLEQDNVMSRSV
jgi:hypothetical protein